MLHDHALPAQILAVQLVNGIVGVAGVLKLHEAVTVFEVDLEQAAVAAEETLDVLLPDMVAQTADVHARHIRGRRGREGERGGKGEEKEEERERRRRAESEKRAVPGTRTAPPRPAPQHNGAHRPRSRL